LFNIKPALLKNEFYYAARLVSALDIPGTLWILSINKLLRASGSENSINAIIS
jgi:hypothetical protein